MISLGDNTPEPGPESQPEQRSLPPLWDFLNDNLEDADYERFFATNREHFNVTVMLFSFASQEYDDDWKVTLIGRDKDGSITVSEDDGRELGQLMQTAMTIASGIPETPEFLGMSMYYFEQMMRLMVMATELLNTVWTETLILRKGNKSIALHALKKQD